MSLLLKTADANRTTVAIRTLQDSISFGTVNTSALIMVTHGTYTDARAHWLANAFIPTGQGTSSSPPC